MPEKINNITQNEFDSLKNMLLSEGMGDVELAYGIINDRYYKNKYDVLIHRLIYIYFIIIQKDNM